VEAVDVGASVLAARTPAEPFADRYRLLRCLKRSNGVETWLADDAPTGGRVVVKTIALDHVHAAARLRFEHETRVLRELTGSGLPGLVDAGEAAGRLFLVQPFLPGRTLEQRLHDGPLPLATALRVGAEVAAALEVAHAAGVNHRDVKPANVVLDDADGGAVALIDFGFARSAWLDESIRDELVGTVRYLAPEAAGLLSSPVDERSDLYSLGVLLYEALSGAPPFPGPTVGDVLRQHLSMVVPELRDSGHAVPRAVDEVLQRLLRKEPAERYQSASALAADLTALHDAVEAGESEPRLVIGRLDQRRTLTDPAFVGRDAELRALTTLLGEVAAGGSGLVVLDAESGGGKSRLLAEMTQTAAREGVTVLHGQGVAQSGARPFTLLHGVADGLQAVLERDPALAERLREELGEQVTAAAQALPSLAAALRVDVADDSAPEQFGEQRSLDALRLLLRALGSGTAPVVVVLDDCQWADRLTERLLATLLDEPAPRLGVVVAFRSEEVPPAAPLRSLAGARPLHLGPLEASAMAALAESMAGTLPRTALDTVVRLADGSPFMGAAVLRGLVESGALVGTGRGWQVDGEAMAGVQAARRSAALLVRRLELLPADALHLLSVGAVLGKEFDVALAVQLAGSSQGAASALDQARRRRLLWLDDRTGRCSFFHDKIREALLGRLSDDDRRVLHGRAADALLAAGEVPVFDLAYHLDAAGRTRQALPHALAAAEQARARHALDTAVVHYRMAERGVPDDDVRTRRRIAEGLGDVLVLQGGYDEAERYLADARALVDDRIEAAALEGKLGDLAFKRGDVPRARDHVEGALARLGRPVPRHAVVLLVRLVWELLVQAVHTAVPRTTGRRAAPAPEADALAMRLYSRLAYVYWFVSGRVPCAWSHLRGMNLAERYPPSAELAQAWSEHAPVMTMVPWISRGERYARRSLEVRTALGDVWGQGQSLGFLGVVLYAGSRYDEAQAACEDALRLLQRTGDRWEANTAQWHVAMCHYRTGRLADAAAVAQEVHAAARAIGDATSSGISLSVLARARSGRVDADQVAGELGREEVDAHTYSELRLAAALHARASGDLEGAAEHLRAAMRNTRRRGLRQEYVAPVPVWYATVLREQVEAWPPHDPRGRRRTRRQARLAVARARWWSLSYRNNAPHALREAALLAVLTGADRRAARLLRRSAAVAERHGAAYETALTQRQLAELRGGDVEAADRAVAALEVPPDALDPELTEASVSLFDRFTTLLAVGREITAATSYAALEDAVRAAGTTLLRGERCHLVQVAALDHHRLLTQSGEPVDAVSRTVLAQAVERREPVVAGEPAHADSESLLLSGMRSVLAAPVFLDGEPVSCFYVTHRQLGHLFGDEEVQLAAFVATLAGAALEHLAGSEARFRSLAQNSSDVLTLVDGDGVVGYQSPAVHRVFGLPAHGVVGNPVSTWVHAADVERFSAALNRALLNGETRVEHRVRHGDGSYRHVETAIRDLRDEPTVRAVVLNTRDISDRRRLEDELRERALHDSLTGLPNRALFLDRARHALERSRRRPSPFVVAFLDLDDFKWVNDTFGHLAGDSLLREVASRLVGCVRPADTVARLGGDEFAVLLEDTDLPDAVDVVERMLQQTSLPVDILGHDVVVHTSIGIARADDPTATPDQLLAQADAAMYSAKARGKHRYDLFAPAMQAAMEQRSRVRSELDRALANDELVLEYQPIVDLRTGRRVGAEALVRWQHPERGLLTPGEFIELAEDSGQILGIGAWVLRTACHDAARLLGDSARVSVNVSPRQLQHPSLVQDVAAVLDETGLSPARLLLEITETATLTGSASEVSSTIDRLAELRELGLQLALDDFGTGYSPLSYLRRFPVDLLKIDRSFVTDITRNPEDEAIVRGVVEMAHALGMKALAEGVEDRDQLELLLALGCDLAQGYLWARPAPVEEAAAALRLPGPRRSGS